MSQEHQQEVDRAFAAIRALCAGETVPPPPRYFNDPSDVLDLMRGAAWVAHALFEPDPDGDNIIQFEIYELGLTDIVMAPTRLYDPDTREIRREHWTMKTVIDAIAACDKVLEAPVLTEGADAPFSGLRRVIDPKIGEEIISRIQKRLDVRGRLPANGGWPNIELADEHVANILMGDLVGHVSGINMGLRAVSRLSGAMPVSYPIKPGGEYARRHAESAMMRLSEAVQTVARDYGLQRQMEGEIARHARKAQEAREEAETARAAALEKHGDSLRDLGTPAAEAILAHLRTGKRLPVYKKVTKNPLPERDALIDGLHGLLGDGAHETLAALISTDPARAAKGDRGLSSLLDKALEDEAPRP